MTKDQLDRMQRDVEELGDEWAYAMDSIQELLGELESPDVETLARQSECGWRNSCLWV